MTSIFLSGGLRITRTNPTNSTARISAPFIARAASLNSAIGRGLRRSKGVGFRGKEKSQPAERYGGNDGAGVRRTAEPRPPAIPAKLTREGWKNDSNTLFPKRGSSSGAPPLTIRKGKLKIKVERDDNRPPKTRSRAARFHDPDSSFGKRSLSKKRAAEAEIASRVEEFEKGGSQGRYNRDAEASLRRDPRGLEKREPRRFTEEKEGQGFPGTQSSSSQTSRFSSSKLRTRDTTPREEYRSMNARQPYNREARPGNGRNFSSPRRSEDVYGSGNRREGEFMPKNSYSSPQDRLGQVERDELRSEPRKNGFRDKYSSATPEHNQPARTESYYDAFAPEPRITPSHVNRNIPLSVPYTTPASEFLYGTSVVSSALQSTRNPRRKLYKFYIYTGPNRENFTRDTTLEHLAQRSSIPIVKLNDPSSLRMLDKMSSGRPHNGYILEASPLPRLPVLHLGPLTHDDAHHPTGFKVALDHQSREEAAINGTADFIPLPPPQYHSHTSRLLSQPRNPLVLLLDSILDPGNLGSIIRTASFLGVSAIAISTHKSASFTPIVLKASAGASENITLFSVSKLASFVTESKKAGWKVYAGVAPPGPGERVSGARARMGTEDLATREPLVEGPCVLMLGSEGEGLKWGLRSKADVDLEIRGSGGTGGVDSLNVSVAAGILCSSFLSGRRPGKAEGWRDGEVGKEEGKKGRDLF